MTPRSLRTMPLLGRRRAMLDAPVRRRSTPINDQSAFDRSGFEGTSLGPPPATAVAPRADAPVAALPDQSG